MENVAQSALDYTGAGDEALLLAFRDKHDKDAVGELVRRYERPLFGYLVHRTGNFSLAEELFQTTFQRVIERSDQFTVGRSFRAWLYSIASHLAIDAHRHCGRQRSAEVSNADPKADAHQGTLLDLVPDREPVPPERLEADEARRIVVAAVDKLPDELRHIVQLVYYQGLTLREVAEVLEIPLGTVKSRLHKALLDSHGDCERVFGASAA
jgi:RNA polymerase sigma-70 factor (ECF subfamily)